ncbi:hypothetical protein BD779DRAFT_1459174 [Infundibulicybe gibba]|nr:hypothetical protein BD779DRAFT_1459174 [Infundibulicybe gibba]
MTQIASVRPRKKSALSMYMQLHYKNRLKARFDPVWEQVKDTVPPEARISMCNEFVRGCWERETKEFQKGIEDRVAEEYAKAMEVYKAKGSWDDTAEAYQEAWDSIDEVLPPIVDAISKRMGMAVSLMLVGPVGRAKGDVILRR